MSRIITLYHGSGALGYEPGGPALPDEEWQKYRQAALKLLTRRGKAKAAGYLESGGFVLLNGTNHFCDEFCVLHRTTALDDYDRWDEISRTPTERAAFDDLARTLNEIGQHVRFIGVQLIHDNSPGPVPTPRIENTSDVVERALFDAERMVTDGNPVNAVDRAHTALHGFLKQICTEAGLVCPTGDPSLTDFVKLLRTQHPKFLPKAHHGELAGNVMKATSAICDALNTIRNRASMAHANEKLLDDADAMLAINASRTILHYVHHRLQS